MKTNTTHLSKRIMMSLFGVLICGLSVGMFKRAALGVDPFQSLMSGLDAVIPISFGTLYVLVNILLLAFSLVFDRHRIGLATLINLFLLGYIAEFSLKVLTNWMPGINFTMRLILLLIAIVIMCLASSFYFTADLGVSTYDAVALVLSARQSRIPFAYCRIITDFICVAAGVVLCLASGLSFREIGASVGIGTIITAFFMGPLIAYFNVHLAQPFLTARGDRLS